MNLCSWHDPTDFPAPPRSGDPDRVEGRARAIAANAVIAPVPDGPPRPFWSVMLPTYRSSDFFEATLQSVLAQDPGPDAMEIVVVDDHSPNRRSEEIVARLAPSRIRFHRNERTLGLAGNWNQCIRMSRGRWIHIMHQDDLILPGFYERLGRADGAELEAGAAFCQHVSMDGNGRWFALSPLERPAPGLLDDWLATIVNGQRIECASIVVRRSVYESLGGFTDDLVFALDWEMWVRIATWTPIWYEPTVLACHRMHLENETTRLRKGGSAFADVVKAFGMVKRYLPPKLHDKVGRELLPLMRQELVFESCTLLNAGDYRTALARLSEACRYDPLFRFSRIRLTYVKWAAMLWLKEWLREPDAFPPRSTIKPMHSPPDEATCKNNHSGQSVG